MTNKSRIKQLEKVRGDAGKNTVYICVIREDEDTGGGYEVKPVGGEPLHFETRKELNAFGERPGVELVIIRIVTAGEEDTPAE